MQSIFVNAICHLQLCSAELSDRFVIVQAKSKLTYGSAASTTKLLILFFLGKHDKLSIECLF